MLIEWNEEIALGYPISSSEHFFFRKDTDEFRDNRN